MSLARLAMGNVSTPPISLVDPKDHMFPRSSPPTFPRPSATKHGFIHLDCSLYASKLLETGSVDCLTKDAVEPFDRCQGGGDHVAESVCGDTQDKEPDHLSFPVAAHVGTVPVGPRHARLIIHGYPAKYSTFPPRDQKGLLNQAVFNVRSYECLGITIC